MITPRAARGLLLALATALATVCACTVSAPILGAGPARPGDTWLFEDALRGARAAGYHPVAADAEAGSFELVARGDRSGATHFVVQCFSDGWVSIVVAGPGVERAGERFRMSPALRDEYAHLAQEIDGAVPVWP